MFGGGGGGGCCKQWHTEQTSQKSGSINICLSGQFNLVKLSSVWATLVGYHNLQYFCLLLFRITFIYLMYLDLKS